MKKIKIFLITLVFLTSLGISPSRAEEHPRYNIEAAVDTQRKTLAAVEEVTFTNNSNQNLNEIYFHIYPNRKYSAREKNFMLRYGGYFKVNPFPSGYRDSHFQIHYVKTENQTLSFAIEGKDQTILKIPLAKALTPGESVKLTLDFSTNLPNAYSRFGWIDTVFKFSHWYPVLSVHDEKGWSN